MNDAHEILKLRWTGILMCNYSATCTIKNLIATDRTVIKWDIVRFHCDGVSYDILQKIIDLFTKHLNSYHTFNPTKNKWTIK